jgi:hypothetical protein
MTDSRFSPPDRIGYYDGQLFAARDLQDDVDGERILRGLHVRSSHNTWGAALGFEVKRASVSVIQVSAGIAHDVRGREIISSHTLNIGPPVRPTPNGSAWWFDLVISYRQAVDTSEGSGCFGEMGPGEERPTWRWCYAGEAKAGEQPPFGPSPDARIGEDVPLVRCRVTAAGFDEILDYSVRRQSQGMVRPHVAGGELLRQVPINAARLAFTTTVNTNAGGFNQTPFYFARISIPNFGSPPPTGAAASLPLGPFVSIRAPKRTSFDLEVRLAANPIVIGIGPAAVATPTLPLRITWVGIEPHGGCPPTLELLSSLFLFLPPTLFIGAHTPEVSHFWSVGGNT